MQSPPSRPPQGRRVPGPFAQRVLDVVDSIPPGRVLSYGEVADRAAGPGAGGGPRQVGRVLAEWGGATPWWRVLRADGTPAPHLAAEALRRLAAEGVPLSGDGSAVLIRAARWDE